MKLAPISACVGLVLAFGVASIAMAQGRRPNQPARRAAGFSSSAVHIAGTTMKAGGTSMETGGDRWIARGFDLKTLVSQIYGVDVRRIDFADTGSAGGRYDVTLVLPREVDENAMQQMLGNAVERKFGLKIVRETRPMDVYVLTAPNGPGAALHPHDGHGMTAPVAAGAGASADAGPEEEGRITYVGNDCPGVSSGGIAASNGTIGELRRTLEPDLDRLLVDETNLTGSYDFKIGSYTSQEELFKLLHEELGLVVTPAQRSVTMLTVRPVGEMRVAM